MRILENVLLESSFNRIMETETTFQETKRETGKDIKAAKKHASCIRTLSNATREMPQTCQCN